MKKYTKKQIIEAIRYWENRLRRMDEVQGRLVYSGPEGNCYATDRLRWFDENGREISAPKSVKKGFNCSICIHLRSLKGTPEEVGGDFQCLGCRSLTSLEGAPRKVGGSFFCRFCHLLTSLEGAPETVGRDFDCSYCDSLTSLVGSPKEVGKYFWCGRCASLNSLEGAPRKVGRCFGYKHSGISYEQMDAYLKWLKTNPTENYPG